MPFVFHRQPRDIQRRDFERFKDAPYFALWWDPRVGKTEETYNIFRYRYEKGDLDALVVFSYPSAVKYVWAEEAAKSLPPEFYARTKIIVWQSGKYVRGDRRKEILALRDHPGPVVLSFNAEAVIVKKAKDYVEWFIRTRRVMLVLDESSFAARWSSRTRKVLALGDWWAGKRWRKKIVQEVGESAFVKRPNVVVKAILDGTPVDETPFDIFYPSEFLRAGLLGFGTISAMRARYCEYQMEEVEEEVNGAVIKRLEHAGKKFNREKASRGNPDPYDRYPIFRGYRNLDELHARMMTFGSRVRLEDVSDAPPKIYQSAFFELTPKQRREYDRLRDEYAIELSGGTVQVDQVLKRMTRLQMVARNYYPPEPTARVCGTCGGMAYLGDVMCESCDGIGYVIATSDLERIDEKNPAAEALVAAARSVGGPFVVWCRFLQDAEDASAALAEYNVAKYTGVIPEGVRESNYQAFKAGEFDAIVATEASGLGRGKDCSRALASIYYSNEFGLRTRRQTESRTEAADRKFSTSVIDLVAADTRDLDVIEALRAKRSLAELVMGDRPTAWI